MSFWAIKHRDEYKFFAGFEKKVEFMPKWRNFLSDDNAANIVVILGERTKVLAFIQENNIAGEPFYLNRG